MVSLKDIANQSSPSHEYQICFKPGIYSRKFYTRRLLLYTAILTEKLRHSYTFIEKKYLFHIPTLEHCFPFLNPWNEIRNDIIGEDQALPTEMLTKNKSYLFSFNLAVL